ncbi:MAG: 4-alpha-glucanotransferase [Candidatus Melainabacteria bacterium]|nr:4-alpha-glucanotransferase [Candidatus Melainabacteria bacterium]
MSVLPANASEQTLVQQALAALGKQNLVLAIHDQSYPSHPQEEIGRGSPYSQGGRDFAAWIASLGFNGLQFGPQGQVSQGNASPYDGTIFSKNSLNLSVHSLFLDPAWQDFQTPDCSPRGFSASIETASLRWVPHVQQYTRWMDCIDAVAESFLSGPVESPLYQAYLAFAESNRFWLLPDALFGALSQHYGTPVWKHWPNKLDQALWVQAADDATEALRAKRLDELQQQYAPILQRYAVVQFLVHWQHQAFQAHCSGLGLKLYGDLQIGFSLCDEWIYQSVFLKHYRMGAPPSRTNPEGQPWNYPILDPAQYATHANENVPGQLTTPEKPLGPALQLVQQRVNKLLAEFDGLRIDHPHGLVCPWGYRVDAPERYRDAFEAVQQGARIFCSPQLADHPELARYAIATALQINPDSTVSRYADHWVTTLNAEQVGRYSTVVDVIVATARARGRQPENILCEVLSTLPYPLAQVMLRHEMGRFRVTQKVNPTDPSDVYRSENAQPADWVMVGNHDTPPIRLVVKRWQQSGQLQAHASYLAERLIAAPQHRSVWVEHLCQQASVTPGVMVHAKLAELFACPAANISVFMADLFGLEDCYNQPGIVNETNWMLRVTPDDLAEYSENRQRLRALHLPAALALAIRARGSLFTQQHQALLQALESTLSDSVREALYGPLLDVMEQTTASV